MTTGAPCVSCCSICTVVDIKLRMKRLAREEIPVAGGNDQSRSIMWKSVLPVVISALAETRKTLLCVGVALMIDDRSCRSCSSGSCGWYVRHSAKYPLNEPAFAGDETNNPSFEILGYYRRCSRRSITSIIGTRRERTCTLLTYPEHQ